MVRAWYMDDSCSDQRLEHHRIPPKYVSSSELLKFIRVELYKIDPQKYETDKILQELRSERGLTYKDEFETSQETLADYEKELKTFFTEHLHDHEEIRLVLNGSGYFDVRDKNDEWIRIEVKSGDLIITPSGVYHRFTLDINNYIKAKRYFVGAPVWTSYNRPADEMECRQKYLDRFKNNFTTSDQKN
ncbi:acireductone dioxygenase-like [Microplitis mediator]|uniref:acireductone dioxygenase-like n=1 Tax=Microplitis mediator TaxID=375433 RepID=UPI00255592DD|nr:acireductone dioxygenase-like [Microplitis mediator]